jgi:hypothetical protein
MEHIEPRIIQGKSKKEAKCPKCGKMMSTSGIPGHMRFVHKTEVGDRKRPIENLVEKKAKPDLFQQLDKDFDALIGFVLHLFDGDDKKLIQTVKKVKKEQDED